MKISVIVFNLSGNPIVRAYPIARVLERHFEVEVTGLYFRSGVFAPYRDEFDYVAVKGSVFPRALVEMRDLYRQIDGDLIYAFKPRLISFGIGLMQKYLQHKPLILDIEDFDTAVHYRHTGWSRARHFVEHVFLKRWQDPRALKYDYITERLTRFADRITVSSRFLQTRYGGTRVPHGADTTVFDPVRCDGSLVRAELGIDPETKVILFAGSPGPHKGLDMLAEAVSRIADRYDLRLMIVGGDRSQSEISPLVEKYGEMVLHVPGRPHPEMPYILAASDYVVLPQQDVLYARAQVPGKLFEAMAMAKPIVASRVSDLPEILEDCGLIFDAGDIDALVDHVASLCGNRDFARDLGRKARERCIARYSWDAMERILTQRVFADWL